MTNKRTKILSAQELSVFCAQIAWLLKAAVPLEEGILAISDSTEHTAHKKQFQELASFLTETGSLTAALQKTDIFPSYLLHMMQIGEAAGTLDEVAASLSDHYHREAQLQAQLKNAILTPLVLIGMIAAVIGILIVKILPIFYQVFDSLGSDLPAGSTSALGFSAVLGKASLCFVLALAILLFLLWILSGTAKGQEHLILLATALPYTGAILKQIDAARFSSVFSMLLRSGYDSTQALDLIPGILNSRSGTDKARQIASSVSSGTALALALRQSGLFSGMYPSMIGVGEKTGNLDTVMEQIARDYSEEAQDRLTRAISFVEPALVGMLSIVIGSILLSIMLPLMGIMAAIG